MRRARKKIAAARIPPRHLVQSATARPAKEQRRREPDARRRENAEGLDREWPDLQRGDDEIRDQSNTRTEAGTTMTFTFILRLVGPSRDSVFRPITARAARLPSFPFRRRNGFPPLFRE